MEKPTANNSDEAASSIVNENNSNIQDEIGRIGKESSVPDSRPTELNNPTPANNNDRGPSTPLHQHQQASDAPLPSSPFIGLEQITGDDAAPVPLSQQIAAINDDMADCKSRTSLEQITCDDMAPVPLSQQIVAINDEKSDHKSRIGLEQITGNDEAPVPLSQQIAAINDEKSDCKSTSMQPMIGLEKITGHDAAPVPLIQQIAAFNDNMADCKSRIGLEQITCDDTAPVRPIQQVAVISLEQITGNDSAPTQLLYFGDFEDSSDLNAAAVFAGVHDDDEPILPTYHQDSMGNTEPTTDSDMQMSTTRSDSPLENVTTNERNNLTTNMQMSTTRSDPQFENVTTNERNNLTTDMQIMSTTRGDTPLENATTNERNSLLHDEEHHNEHLIEAYLVNEDEERTMYDATPELPWWRQRRTKIFIFVICILLSLVAALLTFLRGAAPPPATTLSPSSSPHTSPKVSPIVV
jgi:hypothetical protein